MRDPCRPADTVRPRARVTVELADPPRLRYGTRQVIMTSMGKRFDIGQEKSNSGSVGAAVRETARPLEDRKSRERA